MALQTPWLLAEPSPAPQLRSWFPAALQSQLGCRGRCRDLTRQMHPRAMVGRNWP